MKIKFFGFLVFLSLAFTYLNAQQPYNLIFNHSYQHIERDLYNSDSRFHTAIKPYLKIKLIQYQIMMMCCRLRPQRKFGI